MIFHFSGTNIVKNIETEVEILTFLVSFLPMKLYFGGMKLFPWGNETMFFREKAKIRQKNHA